MSYVKKTWETGDIISAENMNHIENGIYNIDNAVSKMPTFGAINLTVSNTPGNDANVYLGYVQKILYNSTELKYYISDSNDDMDYIAVNNDVTSEFFGWYMLPPSNSNLFMAFTVPSELYEYISETITITGDIEASPVDLYSSNLSYNNGGEVSLSSSSDSNNDKGFIIHGIGNISIVLPEVEYGGGGGTETVA